jgi:hypothetical protein
MSRASRATVNIPPGVEATFRQRMTEKYGDEIPDISRATLAQLMRFAVLREIGVSVENAERSLRGLSRGNTRSENIKV